MKQSGQGITRLYMAIREADSVFRTMSGGQADISGLIREIDSTTALKEDQLPEPYREIYKAKQAFESGMDDDFNTAAAVGALFLLARLTNRLSSQKSEMGRDVELGVCSHYLRELGGRLGILQGDPQEFFQIRKIPILGELLHLEGLSKVEKIPLQQATNDGLVATIPTPIGSVAVRRTPLQLQQWIEEKIAARQAARQAKDFALADKIRDEIKAAGVLLEDSAQGTRWRLP